MGISNRAFFVWVGAFGAIELVRFCWGESVAFDFSVLCPTVPFYRELGLVAKENGHEWRRQGSFDGRLE